MVAKAAPKHKNGFRPGHELKPEGPVINFEQMSQGETEEIARIALAIESATIANDAAKILELFVEMRAAIAPHIVSIPRSWFVDRAPETIDYLKDLTWLSRPKFVELIQAVTAGEQEVRSDAKN